MTALSSKGKKRRKRPQLLHGSRPYGPLVGGKLNPRMSELPGSAYYGSFAMHYRAFVRKLSKMRVIQ